MPLCFQLCSCFAFPVLLKGCSSGRCGTNCLSRLWGQSRGLHSAAGSAVVSQYVNSRAVSCNGTRLCVMLGVTRSIIWRQRLDLGVSFIYLRISSRRCFSCCLSLTCKPFRVKTNLFEHLVHNECCANYMSSVNKIGVRG